VLEADVAVLAEFVQEDFAVIAGTEELRLVSPASSSDICIVKDKHHINYSRHSFTAATQ